MNDRDSEAGCFVAGLSIRRVVCESAGSESRVDDPGDSARSCCCFVGSKTLLIRAKDTRSAALVNVSVVVS